MPWSAPLLLPHVRGQGTHVNANPSETHGSDQQFLGFRLLASYVRPIGMTKSFWGAPFLYVLAFSGGLKLSPPVVPFALFGWESFPTKKDYRKNKRYQLILTSLLENLGGF